MINTKFFSHIIPLLFFTFFISCQSIDYENQMPNVILIMADDIGHEGLSINGSTSYNTPFLDSLALNGINFTNALSQPLCCLLYTSPSPRDKRQSRMPSSA